jgi:hypothetical protein
MNREELEKLSTEALVALTFADMRVRLLGHRRFLEKMVIMSEVVRSAVERDLPANTPGDVATKQVVSVPGRFEDPRIADLPLPLACRLLELAKQLQHKNSSDDVTPDELRELIKDIKQFDADIQPVYDWHDEISKDLKRATLEMN